MDLQERLARRELWAAVPWSPPQHPAFPVHPISWGEGFVVRGTTDVLAAQRAVHHHLRESNEADPDECVPPPVDRAGWFRWNPCSERSCFDGGGHSGHLGYVDGPGRGNFQAVYLSW